MDELVSELTTEEVEHLIVSISLDDATVGDELGIDYWNSNQSQCPKTYTDVMNEDGVMKRKRSRCPKTYNDVMNEDVVMKRKQSRCPKIKLMVMKRKWSRCPKKARGSPPMFPYVLILLFNTKDPIIMWTHDGTGIIITGDKLPKVWNEHFKTIKIASFMKQLLLYGFKNIAGVYMHPVFNRDSKSVRSLITTFHNKKHMKTIK